MTECDPEVVMTGCNPEKVPMTECDPEIVPMTECDPEIFHIVTYCVCI